MRCSIALLAVALLITSAESASAGTISGVIRYEGQAPTMKPIDMKADPACAAKHSDAEPPLNEALVLGPGQTMANVLVEVIAGLPEQSWPSPGEPVVLTQEGCRYAPRVVAVRPGQPLQIMNPDAILHNVNGMPVVNKPFNKAMTGTMASIEVVFDKPEPPFPIKCDVHPWMRAYCAVLSHPFFAITVADGVFKIEGLPAGEYTVQAWHERLGTQTAQVTLAADGTATKDFSFSR